MAQLSAPAIPLTMYRRFAVVTVLVTACVAMFADGGKRGPIADDPEADTSGAEELESGGATLVRRDAPLQRRRFDATSQSNIGEFGSPMIVLPSGGNSGRIPAEMGRSAIPGYSQDYIDSLSEEEYWRLLESLNGEGMLDPQERQRNIRTLEAASRRRSGNAYGIE